MAYFLNKGLKLHYVSKGNGPMLILFPGDTATTTHLKNDIERLSKTYRVIAFDLPGTGKSDRLGEWPLDWWEQSAHLAADFVLFMGEKSCKVIGSSGGGIVALLMGVLYPNLVKALVADSVVESMQPDVIAKQLELRKDPPESLVEFWKKGHGEDWQQVIDAERNMLERFMASGGDWAKGRLNNIICPVLLTGSSQDQDLPDISSQLPRMAAQISSSRVYLSSRGGHPLMWTRSDEFYNEVNKFFSSVYPADLSSLK